MKKTFAVFLALAALLALFACTRQAAGGRSGQTYKIGETGPAGGIVFYDRGVNFGGWRYLEAAPAGTEFNAKWSTDGMDVAGTDTVIGSGKRNTQLIVAALGENGQAAYLCANLNFDKHNDWFLPSKDELNLMYENLREQGFGGFGQGWYWSSSQYNNYAWHQRFSDGGQYSYYNIVNSHSKPDTYLVRAVRAF